MSGGEEAPDARQQAALFWPRVWFYAALSSTLRKPGEVLPFTIAGAGLHVERQADGSLLARLNRAQQGGCLTIPLQCHGGTQLRCPQAACAFSRDRLPVINAETPERERLLRQFLGDRPERLAAIAVREEGGFIRLRLWDEGETEAPAAVTPRFAAAPQEVWWVEGSSPWTRIAHALVQAGGGHGRFHFPNLVLIDDAAWQAAIIMQPLGPALTRCRIAITGAGRDALTSVLALAMDQASEGPEAAGEPSLSLRRSIARICATPSPWPTRRSALQRPNPTFGFVSG